MFLLLVPVVSIDAVFVQPPVLPQLGQVRSGWAQHSTHGRAPTASAEPRARRGSADPRGEVRAEPALGAGRRPAGASDRGTRPGVTHGHLGTRPAPAGSAAPGVTGGSKSQPENSSLRESLKKYELR